ncbi:MAG: ABC-F family ATP-binding cassette domain-containing protein [Hyphomicrobiales bacterium]|nr:ABC-F family ATP-binding cassette domain-containing protein [Hyphomicrobiales bacterium]
MLRIENVTYRIGPRTLLDRASVSIAAGHRVGLVGRNGSGKTTLLKLIMRQLDVDEGSIELPGRWRVGITSQEAPSGPQNLIETVLAADEELVSLQAEADTASDPHRIAEIHARLQDKDAHTAEARAASILSGLGFSQTSQQAACESFSGGWRMRVALAALLFTEPDLLLLDEPTNHLDLEATVWLENYIGRYPGTVLVVSHDRDLLNRVVGEILHLEHGNLSLYQGGYDRFEQTRRMQLELAEKQRAKNAAERERIQAFVNRFRYKATKAKQAQSRLKLLARMEPITTIHDEHVINFEFPDPIPLPPPLISMENIAVGYNGQPVLRDVSIRLDAEDRIALLGANGNGKSTFIKLLAGRLFPLSGQFARSKKLRIGYFAQHQADELDLTVTPVVELGRKKPREAEVDLRKQLGRFGFSQERADTKIAHLSGGEKARLLFALMTADKPHVLLLDEPTNHLDVAARQALIEAINGYPGAVVIVSHDPHVIGLTADRLLLIDDGRVRPFDGDLSDYRSWLLNAGTVSAAGNKGAARDTNGDGIVDRKDQRRLAAERRQAVAPLKKQLSEAERAVHRLEQEKARITSALSDPGLYTGETHRLVKLHTQLDQVQKQLERAEEIWLDLQESFDNHHMESC